MNLDTYKQKATLVRSSDVYNVYDMPCGNLVLSLTELHPSKITGGHSHIEADEVYHFIDGKGILKIGTKELKVKKGDFFHIPRGDFHQVKNTGKEDLVFLCTFEKYQTRGL